VNALATSSVRGLDRVLMVCNPRAGSRRRTEELEALKQLLSAQELVPETVTDLEAIGPLAESLHASGRLRAIVACGGDGTVSEVINRAPPGAPITVFPLGTANLLAGYFGIKRDVRQMARVLAEGYQVRVDAGSANGRVFLLMAGCGFDADVVHRLHGRRSRGAGHISYWSWARPIIESIRQYRYPRLRLVCYPRGGGEPEIVDDAHWAFAVNLPVYAAKLRVAPHARADDGLFDVCTFRGGSLIHGLGYVGLVLLGLHKHLWTYRCTTAERLRIESDEPVPYQLDGDPGGMLPLDIEMLRGRVTLVVPQVSARRRGLPPAGISLQGA
jgi:diacylglycerol kinase (ATP)